MKHFKVLLIVALISVFMTCGLALRARSKLRTKAKLRHKLGGKSHMTNRLSSSATSGSSSRI